MSAARRSCAMSALSLYPTRQNSWHMPWNTPPITSTKTGSSAAASIEDSDTLYKRHPLRFPFKGDGLERGTTKSGETRSFPFTADPGFRRPTPRAAGADERALTTDGPNLRVNLEHVPRHVSRLSRLEFRARNWLVPLGAPLHVMEKPCSLATRWW